MNESNKPDWGYWLNRADVELICAIELSCGIAPGWLEGLAGERYIRADHTDLKREIETRLRIARSHIDAGTLRPDRTFDDIDPLYGNRRDTFFDLANFRSWGESLPKPFAFPDEFPKKKPRAVQVTTPPPRADTDKPLDTRERLSLLRIIRALSDMASLPARGASASVEAQLEKLGFDSPREATIRKTIEDARSLEPDKNPQ